MHAAVSEPTGGTRPIKNTRVAEANTFRPKQPACQTRRTHNHNYRGTFRTPRLCLHPNIAHNLFLILLHTFVCCFVPFYLYPCDYMSMHMQADT